MSDTPAAEAKKKPSGAAYRRQRAERAEADADRERQRRVLQDGEPTHTRWDVELPEDPVGIVTYANRAAAFLLDQVMRDPILSLEEKLKQAKPLIDAIGITTAKAITDRELLQLRELVAELQRKASPDAQERLDQHPAAGRGAG